MGSVTNSHLPGVVTGADLWQWQVTYPACQVQQQSVFNFLLKIMGLQGLFKEKRLCYGGVFWGLKIFFKAIF